MRNKGGGRASACGELAVLSGTAIFFVKFYANFFVISFLLFTFALGKKIMVNHSAGRTSDAQHICGAFLLPTYYIASAAIP